MNNSELNRLLKSAKIPAQSAEHWEDFPGQVVRALRALPLADYGSTDEVIRSVGTSDPF